MPEFVGAIDQGTTSTRFIVFDSAGEIRASAQKEHRQIFPRPGWVEHDPSEIWVNTVEVIETALTEAGLTSADLAAVGIANQRETTVLWDRVTGEPMANAIVWQDTRTDDICAELAAGGGQDRFRVQTGLPVATYFSGPKVSWLLDEMDLRSAAERGRVAFGTIDSWLAWNLTGRHLTDPTNASRTLLYDLSADAWDPGLAEVIGVPVSVLPEVVDSVGVGEPCLGPLEGVPLAAILGDQQAALFGQTCFEPGEAKNTYGTGNFLLLNTGEQPVVSSAGLITTVACRIAGEPTRYALEGAIAVTGSLVQWLRDNLGLISDAAEVEDLAASVPDTGDVYFVPAFSGLFAPHWRSDARGVIVGLTRFTDRRHLARAALEATAFQTVEVLRAMSVDSGTPLTELRVDGGMTRNDLLMQFQSNVLGIDVVRPKVTETTALGAAYAAGLAVGLWTDLDEVRQLWAEDKRWSPRIGDAERDHLANRWAEAVERSLGWA